MVHWVIELLSYWVIRLLYYWNLVSLSIGIRIWNLVPNSLEMEFDIWVNLYQIKKFSFISKI